MMTAASKKAKGVFDRLVLGKSGPASHTKGKTGSGTSSEVTGHKAPNATKGKGSAFRPGKTKSGPGFKTGHKAKHISHGKG